LAAADADAAAADDDVLLWRQSLKTRGCMHVVVVVVATYEQTRGRRTAQTTS
jgi:hypothetical protein